MAIIYSYPHAVPTLGDMVLGARFRENEGISTNSFYVSDLVTLITAEIPGIPGSEGPQGPAGTTGSQGIQGPQGDQGVQGLAGTVGPAGLEWQGTWESGTSYAADDAVAYDGASWFCILATSGTTPPDVDTTHWALLAAQGAQGLQGIQGIQGIQGPVGATGTQGIQGVQGLPGAAATQTLQQTVDLGNTISGTQGGINFTTTLTNTSVKVGASTISGMTLNTTQLICEKNNGNDLIALQFPTVYSGIRQITLPATTGTVALTSDVTLQKAYNGGNTIVSGNFKTGVFDSINGISVENTSSLSKTTLETTKITLTKNASGLKTTNILQAVTPTQNRTIYFPDANGTIALTTDINTPTLQQVLDEGNSALDSSISIFNTVNDIETSINEFGNGLIVLKSLVNNTLTEIGAGSVNISNFSGDFATILKDRLVVNSIDYLFPTGASSPLATLSDIPNLGPLTQGPISSVSPTIPYDVMPYRINISLAPTSSHISLPNTNLTIGQEVYIQTINAAIIHGNPSNTSATTIFTSSGASVSNFTTSAGAFYKFTYLGVLDTYAPNARWVYQVLNQ